MPSENKKTPVEQPEQDLFHLPADSHPLDTALFSSLIHSLPLNVYAKNSRGEFIFANSYYCQNVGKKLEDIIGTTDYQVHPAELADKYRADDAHIMENRCTERIEESWQSIGGKGKYIQVIKSPLFDSGNPDKVIGTLGVFWDITNQKQAEKTLAEERNLLRTLIDTIPAYVYVKDRASRFIAANKAVANLMGEESPDTVIGKTDFEYYKTDMAQALFNSEQELIRSEQPLVDHEELLQHRDDRQRWLVSNKVPLRNLSGEVVGLVGVGLDITGRKRIERELLDSEKLYASVIKQAFEGIYLLDPKSKRILEYNDSFQRLLGYDAEELSTLKAYDFVASSKAEIDSIVSNLMEDKGYTVGERQYRRKNGILLDVEISAKLITFSGNEALLVIVRDITERKRADEERITIKKLESVGVLAGGIAHDFNNILTGVLGNIELAMRLVKDDHPAHDRLELSKRAVVRARELTTKLLTFSSGGDPVRKVAYLPELIKESAKFALSGSNVLCTYNIDDSLWPVEMDFSQISQVIQNLIVNATQAMPDGGRVTVTCTNVSLEASDVVSLSPGPYVKIIVTDTGEGIAIQHLKNIFDPYFTTKTESSTKGRGLGLAISMSIIKKHDGTMTVASEPGIGTAFTLYIPALPDELPGPGETHEPLPVGSGRILVMDDEELIRDIMTDLLNHLGYEVLLSSHGEEALAIYQREKDSGRPIDVVIMDLTIPGKMGGKEAVKALHAVDDQARVIVSSGYSTDPILENYQHYGFSDLVSKPFKLDELSQAINRVLDM